MTAVVVIGQRSIVAKKVGTDETPLVVQQSTVNAAVQVLPVPKQVVVVKALKGDKGLPVELQSSATHLQWRYVGAGAWTDLVALADITGPAGPVPEAPVDGSAYARKDSSWVAAVPASEKGAAGGVAPLDGSGKLAESYLPAVAITDVFAVASQAAMLALTAERGDVAVRSDLNKSFVLSAEPASTLGNWVELRTPTDAVLSVAGKTGAVSLVKGDVGLGNVDNTADSSKSVASAAVLTTARTISVGSTGKTFDGSANVGFTLAEVGAAYPVQGALRTSAFTAGINTVEAVDPQTCTSVNGPTATTVGQFFELHDTLSKFGSYPMTLYAGSVNGVAAAFICDIAGAAFRFVWEGSTWRVSIVARYS